MRRSLHNPRPIQKKKTKKTRDGTALSSDRAGDGGAGGGGGVDQGNPEAKRTVSVRAYISANMYYCTPPPVTVDAVLGTKCVRLTGWRQHNKKEIYIFIYSIHRVLPQVEPEVGCGLCCLHPPPLPRGARWQGRSGEGAK